MHRTLLDILCCPECAGELALRDARESGDRVESGTLECASCRRSYEIRGFVPRFVPPDNYAANFGFQWNRFGRTQLDSHSGVPISRDRLLLSMGVAPEELRGKLVLDVGCGSGRFAEAALGTGARVVALDYSSAVDACQANLGSNAAIDVVQGDVYKLPFRPGTFDHVYCLGVLQHTPDVKASFMALTRQVRAGGRLTVDVYAKLALNVLWPKYWLHWLTRRIPPRRLFSIVERAVPWLLPISDAVARVPVVGKKLRYAVPVMNHRPNYPQLSDRQLREWAVLDTFDMFGPTYDQPQSVATIESWFREAGMRDVEVFRHGAVIGRGVR